MPTYGSESKCKSKWKPNISRDSRKNILQRYDMAEAKKFTYDPEGEEENSRIRFLRLPFALCKRNGIAIQDWWRPRDAWKALKEGGFIEEPSEEMKKLLKKLKNSKTPEEKEKEKQRRAEKKARKEQIEKQEALEEHTPDKNPIAESGYIASTKRGKPMTHEEADNGNVNPFYGKGFIGYKTNCQTCVATYVARLQGYDVSALPNLNNREIAALSHSCFSIYQNQDGSNVKINTPKRGQRKLNFIRYNVKDGDVRAIAFRWVGASYGHVITVTKKNGEIEFYDPQCNETIKGEKIRQYLQRTTDVRLSDDLRNAVIDKNWADKIMKGKKK